MISVYCCECIVFCGWVISVFCCGCIVVIRRLSVTVVDGSDPLDLVVG